MSEDGQNLPTGNLVRLAELAEKLRDNALADAEVAELETVLAESAAARHAFARLALLTAELQHSQGRLACPTPVVAQRRFAQVLSFRRWLPFAAAACLAGAALAVWRFVPLGARAPGEAVAGISNASGAILVAGDRTTPARVGSTLHREELFLRSGLLELTYPSGVVIVLESPARFELRGAGTLWLAEGNASANVPGTAVGFTVDTPSASVVDLGTEFGVRADATSSEVHVFKGSVMVKNSREPDPLWLPENRAARIDIQSHTPTGIDFQPDRFLRSLDEPPSGYRDLVLQLEPIAYYWMHITSDPTRLLDITAQRLHGRIIQGAGELTSARGRVGAGLRLGGPTLRSYAIVPDFPKAPKAALTVCAWVWAESRPRWASIAKNWVKDQRLNLGGQFHFGLWHDEGSLEVHVHDDRGEEIGVRDDRPLPLGRWQFVAFTVDGSMLRLFRQGREIASTPCSGLATSGPDVLALGVKLGSSGQEPAASTPGFWDGILDEVAVFHRALSPAEIRALYDAAR